MVDCALPSYFIGVYQACTEPFFKRLSTASIQLRALGQASDLWSERPRTTIDLWDNFGMSFDSKTGTPSEHPKFFECLGHGDSWGVHSTGCWVDMPQSILVPSPTVGSPEFSNCRTATATPWPKLTLQKYLFVLISIYLNIYNIYIYIYIIRYCI